MAHTKLITLPDCQALDAQDPLRPLRALFTLPQGVIYLDGNSLGALPQATAARMAEVVTQEWGQGLIRSWNAADWVNLPQRLGNLIAPLIGAGQGEVVVADSTSINVFKGLSAAVSIANKAQLYCGEWQKNGSKKRDVILSESSNFPTDLYLAESVCQQHGLRLVLVDGADSGTGGGAGALLNRLAQGDVAVLLLTHVNYRTGAMHNMAAVTAAAHAAGALVVWDLAHSAGAVPLDVTAADADFAVGCGYKYLNGGPGAPAFIWANPRRTTGAVQPLAGWFGHVAPFQFSPQYQAAPGINRYVCGTPPVLSMAALECGLAVFGQAQVLGGMAALRAKSLALTDLFITLIHQRCAAHGLRVVTPLAHAERGSQVSVMLAAGRDEGYAVMQALIARGVIGDYRTGILRFGFTPLYVGFADVWLAVAHLAQVLDGEEWRRPAFAAQHTVT